MKIIKSAFTLVELIVVITILAVLATIGFISMQGYVITARDSVRITDVTLINKGLSIYVIKNSDYPLPSGPLTSVTFSGTTVFNQGTFGQSVIATLQNISSVPLDPLTGSEYTYSLLSNKREYEIASILESSLTSNIVPDTYADGEQLAKSYVRGKYNGQVAKVNIGLITYILALPTIINSNLSYTALEDIVAYNTLAYKGTSILPASFSGTVMKHEGKGTETIVNSSDYIVYSGDINLIDNKVFIEKLKAAYIGTTIADNNESIISILSIDTTVEYDTDVFAAAIINNYLGGSIAITSTPTPTMEEVTQYFLGDIIPVGTKLMLGDQNCPVGWTDSGEFVAGGGGPDKPEKCGSSGTVCKLCEFTGVMNTEINFLTGDSTCRTGWEYTGTLIAGGGRSDIPEKCEGINCNICKSTGYIEKDEEITLVFGGANTCPESWEYTGTLIAGGSGPDRPEKCGTTECSICSYDINDLENRDNISGTCTGLPLHASYNGGVQSYTVSDASPDTSLIASYITDPKRWNYHGRENSCEFICNYGYTWNGASLSCEANTKTTTCGGTVVANATASTATTYTQTMSGSTWTPTTYWGEDQATCDFTCDTNYTWNGTSCFISTCNFGSTNIGSCNL